MMQYEKYSASYQECERNGVPDSTTEPVGLKPYRLPYKVRESLRRDIDDMLRMGVIQHLEGLTQQKPWSGI